VCTNDLFWQDYSMVKNDKGIAIFDRLPYFKDLFSDFRKTHSTGSEFYDIELSDWYQVLSKLKDSRVVYLIK